MRIGQGGGLGRYAPSGRYETALKVAAFKVAVVIAALASPCGGWAAYGAAASGAGSPGSLPIVEAIPASAELVALASAVVIGTVVEAAPAWTPDRTMIVTTYRIRVGALLAGKTDPLLDLTTEGGAVDGTSLRVSNSPSLIIGQEYLLLVGDLPDRRCILGGALGAFPLTQEEADSEASLAQIAACVKEIRMAAAR